MRIIAHLDMDAFYANAEMIRHPALKGRPVVVGGPRGLAPPAGQDYPILSQYQGRGVLTTANYEARKLGLHSAMPTMKAAKLAPHAVLLPADFEYYKLKSRQFKAAAQGLAPVMENRGIDEIYLDLTEQTQGQFDAATELAKQLKQAVWQATEGMTCSIGLSPNKLISKIASDLDKPDGLTVIRPSDFEARIWPLPVGKINGVGPKAQAKLVDLGVLRIADLAQLPVHTLIEHFGQAYGAWLHDAGWGRDDRVLDLGSDPKSMSRETTFERDMHVRRDRAALGEVLVRLTNRLAEDLARKGMQAKTLGVKVRFPDFKSLTRDHSPPSPLSEAADLLSCARQALKKMPFEPQGLRANLRLLGVKAAVVPLRKSESESSQLKLFD